MDPCILLGKIHILVMIHRSSTAWPLSAPEPHLSPIDLHLIHEELFIRSEYSKFSHHSFPFYSLIFQFEESKT